MMSESGKQTIAIHILPSVSRSKGNQAMKFAQLLQYNMKNTFSEESNTKFGGETSSDLFLKQQD